MLRAGQEDGVLACIPTANDFLIWDDKNKTRRIRKTSEDESVLDMLWLEDGECLLLTRSNKGIAVRIESQDTIELTPLSHVKFSRLAMRGKHLFEACLVIDDGTILWFKFHVSASRAVRDDVAQVEHPIDGVLGIATSSRFGSCVAVIGQEPDSVVFLQANGRSVSQSSMIHRIPSLDRMTKIDFDENGSLAIVSYDNVSIHLLTRQLDGGEGVMVAKQTVSLKIRKMLAFWHTEGTYSICVISDSAVAVFIRGGVTKSMSNVLDVCPANHNDQLIVLRGDHQLDLVDDSFNVVKTYSHDLSNGGPETTFEHDSTEAILPKQSAGLQAAKLALLKRISRYHDEHQIRQRLHQDHLRVLDSLEEFACDDEVVSFRFPSMEHPLVNLHDGSRPKDYVISSLTTTASMNLVVKLLGARYHSELKLMVVEVQVEESSPAILLALVMDQGRTRGGNFNRLSGNKYLVWTECISPSSKMELVVITTRTPRSRAFTCQLFPLDFAISPLTSGWSNLFSLDDNLPMTPMPQVGRFLAPARLVSSMERSSELYQVRRVDDDELSNLESSSSIIPSSNVRQTMEQTNHDSSSVNEIKGGASDDANGNVHITGANATAMSEYCRLKVEAYDQARFNTLVAELSSLEKDWTTDLHLLEEFIKCITKEVQNTSEDGARLDDSIATDEALARIIISLGQDFHA